MRKIPKQRRQRLPRPGAGKRGELVACDDPHDSWDQFEVFVMLMAASRAMEKFREAAAAAALASRAEKIKAAAGKRLRQPQAEFQD